jgi:hypothetical protein
MKIAIMQPYFFPYLGYFQLINAVDKFIIYENVSFIKKGWIHRNRILEKYRHPLYFGVDLSGKSSNKNISELYLQRNSDWQRKLVKKISMNYKGSAFYEQVFPLIQDCINIEEPLLHNYNSQIIKKIVTFLDIETEVQYENSGYLDLKLKLENGISKYGEYDTKVKRIFEICKKEGADNYINAIGGLELYRKSDFIKQSINLHFIKSNNFEYKQFSNQFHPNLSIIDVLMHNGKEETKKLLNNYNLI